MPQIERPGRFRSQVVAFAIEPSKSSRSVGLWCKFALVSEWNEKDKVWMELSGLDTCTGTIWFIGKDGNKNERGIETLINSLNWDQNPDSLAGTTGWVPADCQVIVEKDSYNGKDRWKAQWINPWEGDGQPKKKAVEPSMLDSIKSILSGTPAPQGGADVPF